jgi:hypothetical protein
MSDPVWLPEVLRDAGLVVHEYPGWRDRGHGDFGKIWGVVCHHTGSYGETARGIAEHPQLGLASQIFLSRSGELTICGAGVAWHAGEGSYPGIPDDSANQYTIGIEAANDGGGSPGLPHRYGDVWSDEQYNAYVRTVAAILTRLGQPASHAIGHKEWAGAAQGKWDPGAIDKNIFRHDVQKVMSGSNLKGDDMGVLDESFTNFKNKAMKFKDLFWWLDKNTSDALDQLVGPDKKGWKILGKSRVDPTRDNTLVEAISDLQADVADIKAAIVKDKP